LREDDVAPVAVYADARSRNQNPRWPGESSQRLRQEPGTQDPAVPDPALPRGGPADPDRLAREMDDGVDPVEPAPVDPAGHRVPADLVVSLGTAGDDDDRVASRREEWDERSSQQSTRPGDGDDEARAVPILCVRGEVRGQDLVAIGQHPLDPPERERPGEAAGRAAGRSELDPIGDP